MKSAFSRVFHLIWITCFCPVVPLISQTLTPRFDDNLIVKNTNDSGPESLRDVIAWSNSNEAPGAEINTIRFDMPGPGLFTILLQQELVIDVLMVIDGYTQGNIQGTSVLIKASENTLQKGNNAVIPIILDGSNIPSNPPTSFGNIITVRGSNVTIRGLCFVNGNVSNRMDACRNRHLCQRDGAQCGDRGMLHWNHSRWCP